MRHLKRRSRLPGLYLEQMVRVDTGQGHLFSLAALRSKQVPGTCRESAALARDYATFAVDSGAISGDDGLRRRRIWAERACEASLCVMFDDSGCTPPGTPPRPDVAPLPLLGRRARTSRRPPAIPRGLPSRPHAPVARGRSSRCSAGFEGRDDESPPYRRPRRRDAPGQVQVAPLAPHPESAP